MSKLEETNLMIDYLTKLEESGIKVNNTVILADIAKSLAMIADKLCGAESEDENGNTWIKNSIWIFWSY